MKLKNVCLTGTIDVNVELGNISVDEVFNFFLGVVTNEMANKNPNWIEGEGLKVGDIYVDIYHTDQKNLRVSGIPIEGYRDVRKFKEFHKEMGIDYDAIIARHLKTNNLIPTRKQIIDSVGPEIINGIKLILLK